MNLNQIINKLKYPHNTANGTRYYVEVDNLLKEIKKSQIEAKKNKELKLIKKLGFREVKDSLFVFVTDEHKLFFDYRKGKRRSFAVDIDNKEVVKTNVEVYNIFKLIMQFR